MIPDWFKSAKLPETPGVYFFRDGEGHILYIGKATCLRDRVRSYFNATTVATRGPKIEAMLALARSVDTISTDSVLEALLLESKEIKAHQPPYNTDAKDDKSYNCVVITDETFPRVLVYRGRTLLKSPPKEKIAELYGPFPSGGSLRQAMKIIRRLFPYRDSCTPACGTPCFNRQIGLCPGVCTGDISSRDYKKQITHLRLFFEGKKSKLLDSLTRDMKRAADALEFERAGEIKKTIFSLSHIQDVALIKQDPIVTAPNFRIEAYDIAHTSGIYRVGAMTVIEDNDPKPSEYRRFKIKQVDGINDIACLHEVLRRRFSHDEWRLPDLIVIDGSAPQRNTALSVLTDYSLEIPVVAVVKDERHRPKHLLGPKDLCATHEQAILHANAESHRFAGDYHRKLRDKIKQS